MYAHNIEYYLLQQVHCLPAQKLKVKIKHGQDDKTDRKTNIDKIVAVVGAYCEQSCVSQCLLFENSGQQCLHILAGMALVKTIYAEQLALVVEVFC